MDDSNVKEKARAKSREYYKRWYELHKEDARKKKRKVMRRLRAENPERYRAHCRASQKRLKDAVFKMYGKECVRCGFEDIRALTLDHVKNNGAEERKRIGERGTYRRAIEKHRPREYQILCMNCQFIKRVIAKRQNQH